MSRSLQLLTLAALLTLPCRPATAQEEEPTSPAEEGQQNTTVSIGSIERQVFEQDGDLMIYLQVQDLELKVGNLVLALRLQDLPQLNKLLSSLGTQSGEDRSGSGEQDASGN